MLEACAGPPKQGLHPLAQERMIAIGKLWYYENIITGKKRRFPRADDWDDEVEPEQPNPRQKPITQLMLITATISCGCGTVLKFKHHYTDPAQRSSRKCDQIYVYYCSACPKEVELKYPDLVRMLLEAKSI